MLNGDEASVLKIVQELIVASAEPGAGVTPTIINEKIDLAFAFNPKWRESVDKAAVNAELIRRFSIWIGDDTLLEDRTGHEAWLTSSRKKDWRYWQRYREMIEKDLSWDIADKLDQSTDRILGMLEDPKRTGVWGRRGLVVGHVQSGKTASYTGLVCKAADAQYKIIIVLAGLHNNLRSQTQIRLEEGFLGYETEAVSNTLRRIGVGLIDSDMSIKPNCATSRGDDGDFWGRGSKQLSITPEQRPWLFVVKKNKSVLVRLLKWIQNHVADQDLSLTEEAYPGSRQSVGGIPAVTRRVTEFPLLIIDDEADNASVDTGEIEFDENGRVDEEYRPSTINRLIRRILHSFSRSAYVGYTATPFANIFIHERAESAADGKDLFPSSFIQNLAAPSSYVGPAAVFGRPGEDGRVGALPLVRTIEDHQSLGAASNWMPVKHKATHSPRWSPDEPLPPTLREAIDAFLIACAVRSIRGQGAMHSSMLVHVTRYNVVQTAVFDQVEAFVRGMRQSLTRGIGHFDILDRLRLLWDRDFLPSTRAVRASGLGDVPQADVTWDQVEQAIVGVIGDIEVRTINGTAKDVLDYEANKATGLKVIAIGGDKLSRGLTLEGLCTSYFLRASAMYDTLMQMGRWFGYRQGYLDLCRLYTSPDLIRWFKHVSDASSELREEFDLMASSGATPRNFGLKVRAHPDLTVTSPAKMRSAQSLKLSFSGQLMQTVSFSLADGVLERNLSAGRELLVGLGAPTRSGIFSHAFAPSYSWSGYLWSDCSGESVTDFLMAYETSEHAHRVNSKVLADFIRRMMSNGELTKWSVAVVGRQTGTSREIAPGISVNRVKRTGDPEFSDRYAIGVLLDPKDEAIDLTQAQWVAALDMTVDSWKKRKERDGEVPVSPSGPAIRRVKGLGAPGVHSTPDRGLLVLYLVDPSQSGLSGAQGKDDVLAFGISFPESTSDVKVEYKVTRLLWEQQFGPLDDAVMADNESGVLAYDQP